MSNKGGSAIGTTTGVLLGFVLTMTGFADFALMGILSIAGMIAGLLKNDKKIGTVFGFLAGGIITAIYLDITMLNLELLYSIILAVAAFMFIPRGFSFNIAEALMPAASNSKEYLEKVKEHTTDKLEGFSLAFNNLANTFSGLSEKKTSLDQHDISRLIDDVANKTCISCANRDHCWGTEFYNTYQMYFAMLGICEKKGDLAKEDLPTHLQDFCIQKPKLIEQVNKMFEVYKNNILWHNKIVESRDLVSQQLAGISEIIGSLAKELTMEFNFKEQLEEDLLTELNKNKIEVHSVIVLESKEGKHEVTLNFKGSEKKSKEAIDLVSRILGRKMVKDDSLKMAKNRIRLLEEQKYRVVSGVARLTKEDSMLTGDSHSLMHIKSGQCLLMLSDGMGSGRKAHEESAAAIEIFEDFIETGFDKETAIKIVNSVLVLKSNEDSFSTLDICALDLYSGVCEFIKIGASSTYILREGTVQVIKNKSLPMGILSDVEVESTKKRLKDGDILVMVTDGVTDFYDMEPEKESFLVEVLSQYKGVNPQDIADHVLAAAKEKAGGVIKDDMTVMAARVWEYSR